MSRSHFKFSLEARESAAANRAALTISLTVSKSKTSTFIG